MYGAILSRSRVIRTALFVVLLAAQSLALAHEYSHWNHPSQELCATCSLSSNLDTPAAPTQAIPVAVQDPQLPDVQVESHVRKLVVTHYAQRAPPISL